MESQLKQVDHSAIKTSQVTMLIWIILAFVLGAAWMIAILAIILLSGVLRKRPAFDFIYTGVLRPRGWVKPEVLLDHPEPHRFSQLLGTLFLAGSALALFSGQPVIGWGLSWMVAALAALNAFGGFCVGCAMYYWLNRLGVPGFKQSALEGIIPGRKPKAESPHQSQPSIGN